MPDNFFTIINSDDYKNVLPKIMGKTNNDVISALSRSYTDRLSPEDFMALLSPAATHHLEDLAIRANELTLQYFGKTVQLFTPLYLSNYCSNKCLYCGFNTGNRILRHKLSLAEIEAEGKTIAASGLRSILLLTGEAPGIADVEYIADAARCLRPYFPDIGVEVYSMTVKEYRLLIEAGVNSLTLFQETYNESLFMDLHPAGPKRNFRFRLETQDRAARAGMRSVSIGALLGLDIWQRDAFFTGIHACWLQKRHPGTDIGISVPRMRPHEGSPIKTHECSERDLTQYILALRLFLPHAGITVSTRERAYLRDNLLALGVTRVSAGVSTSVGGHAIYNDKDTGQFDIADNRSVEDMITAIRSVGYQPVFKNWEPLNWNYDCGLATAM